MNRQFRTCTQSLVAIGIFFLLAQAACAQYSASIQGVVLDAQGALVTTATVTLVNTETNWSKTNKTNGQGIFTFNSLPPSAFTLTVEAPGFKRKVLTDIHVIPEQANGVNVTLDVGQTSETVDVDTSGAAQLDTETATVSGTVTTRDIEHMPSFGRDVFQLAQLTPGIFGDGAQASGGGSQTLPSSTQGGSGASQGIFASENDVQITANGQQNQTNSITIDGVSTTDAVFGGETIITPSEEAVKDMNVVAESYDAEDLRLSGAQIKITTKNGTNQYHGSGFFKLDRPGLNAYQRYNGPNSLAGLTAAQKGVNRDAQRFNQFGGSLGGFIWRDRIFGFFSYEGLRNSSNTTAQGWYEAPQFLAMAPTGSIASTVLSFPGEGVKYSSILTATCATIGLTEGKNCATIPGQGLNLGSPIATPLGTQDLGWTSTGNPGVGSGLTQTPTIAEYNTVNPTLTTDDQYFARLDARVTKKDLLIGTFFWVPTVTTNYLGDVRSANFGNSSLINNAFTAIWNHTFNANLVNEARANASGFRFNQIASNPDFPFGLPHLNIGSAGSASINTYGTAFAPAIRNQWTYSYGDTLTAVRGRHQLKAGAVLTRLYYLQTSPNGAIPTYSFHNMWDFLNDAPYQESGSFNPASGQPFNLREDCRDNQIGVFAQDNFKLLSNLTINLGLRWEYFGAMYSKDNNFPVVNLGTGQNMLTGASVAVGAHLYQPTKGDWGPQIGFSWAPVRNNGRFVLRGGFGIGYDQFEISIQANGYQNFPVTSSITIGPYAPGTPASAIVYSLANGTKNFYGYPVNPNAKSAIGANNLPVAGSLPVGVQGVPHVLPNGVDYHYNLDTQYDLGRGWMADIGYMGNVSRHLSRREDLNVIALAQGIPYNPELKSVFWVVNDANLSYNSLVTVLKRNFSRGFSVQGQYVWAKGMDDGSGRYEVNAYEYNPSLARGRSDYNVTNAGKLFGTYSPSLFRGRHDWLEKTVGGWALSGIMNLHTGFPWTPEYTNVGNGLFYSGASYANILFPSSYNGLAGHDTSNTAFRSGQSPVSSAYNKNFSQGALTYFTVPSFTPGPTFPARGTLPQGPGIQRNSFNGPNYRDVDMTLLKSFGLPNNRILGERSALVVRMDAYNVFNLENLTNINNIISTNGTTSNPSFGQAQAGLGSRTISFQARFQF